ncbi:MAG TPA: hypothetical protein DEP84_02745 [Chloroflexi bacterium]|nr:hypothetical protein [Chloroflexota bacterium]
MTDIEKLEIPEDLELDEGEPQDEVEQLAPEPLFTALLRRAVRGRFADDPVRQDVVELLATPMTIQLAAKTAKGGDFAEQKAAAGADVARYRRDQSLRAHLFNGLLPVLHIGDLLQAWGAPQFRRWDEETRRLFVGGYALHDWVKLPDVAAQLKAAGLGHDANPNLNLPFIEDHFSEWMQRLNLTAFLEPIGGAEKWLHELIYIAANTQEKWGTMQNLKALPNMHWSGPRRLLVMTLCSLADKLSYSVHRPVELTRHVRICTLLANLGDGAARLTSHHLTENRGVLTNLLHNAALDGLAHEARVPILYAPSGVVYLERTGHAPPLPRLEEIADRAVEKVRQVCALQVQNQLPGFQRGKQIKFPPFYWLFFTPDRFIEITPRAVIRKIPFNTSTAIKCKERYEKAVKKGLLPPTIDISSLPVSARVDQLAELLQLWESEIARKLSQFPTRDWIFPVLGIQDFRNEFEQIDSGSRAGGTPYNWYVAAAVAQGRQKGLDDAQWEAWLQGHADALAEALRQRPQASGPDGWQHLRAYATQTIRLDDDAAPTHTNFAAEFGQYQNAKKKGRGTTKVCSLCAAAFSIEQQEEPAVLFAPAVYSNRLPLHGGKTQRNICAVCSLEMMLRKLLMAHTQASGKNFEARKERYLFFYPTYFFTPETLDMLRALYRRLKKVSITALRKSVLGNEGDRADVQLDPATLQRLEDLLLEPIPADETEYDRLSRMHYPTHEPMMFDFIGIPPGRDPTDTQAWIQPALLALLLPLQLDVKVVASESPIPLFTEAGDLDETAFLDGPASAIRYLSGKERLTLDDITKDNRGALQRLITGYFIHTDANAGMGRTGFDYRWQQFPAVARNLADSPLYAFHYLKKWQRREGFDSLPPSKVQQYLAYFRFFDVKGASYGGITMSHAQELTRLYRQFYRAEGYKSNAILRPITVAANAILDADPRLFRDPAALEEAVWGEVQGFVNRVRQGSAQGRGAAGVSHREADQAVRDFARYFVHTVYAGALKMDAASLRGRQLNLLKNACEVLYLNAERTERTARKAAGEAVSEDEVEED